MTAQHSSDVTTRCATFPGATLDNTFGEDTDVHRVGNKMYALVNVGGGESVTLKATPDDVAALITEHDFVRPGYYMNKKHWITLDLSADIESEELWELITESYRLVFASLPKKLQREIEPSADSR